MFLWELPSVRTAGRRYLSKTLEETYQYYIEDCLKLGKERISFFTFCHFWPKNVYTIDKTPDRQCICDVCENFRLLQQAMKNNGIKGIPPHTNECIRQSRCDVSNASNSDSNADTLEDVQHDGLHQVDPNYGHFSCINHDCKKYGTDLVLMKILESNEGILKSKDIVTWMRWQWVPKEKGSKSKKLDLITYDGTKKELINWYLKDLKGMSYHLFSCHWNYSQFVYCRENLKPGQLLQVLDFGQNYINITKISHKVFIGITIRLLHLIVNYYLDDNGKMVTEEHLMISDDLRHDKFAVREFEKVSLQKLKDKGFVPEQIIQFCDNCAGQYKSKGPFQFISDSGIPTLRMFF